jgi:hypothetical protein
MLRFISTLLLILAGCALGAVLVCLLAFRLVFSIVFALCGARRQVPVRDGHVLDW